MACEIINGGVKFFEKNWALLRNGASASATSNEDTINSILDVSKYTRWESEGSNDLTTETITINLKSTQTIDRLFLVGMNFKQFKIKYYNGLSYVDFSNVVGVNGATSTLISETDYTYTTAYYQFDSVSTSSFQVEVTKTQTADEEKYLNQFISTSEIGTLEGFPRVRADYKRNETKAKTLSKKLIVQKTYETNRIKINFKTHPYQNDADIITTLVDREEPFLIYPCGGRTGTNYFKIEQPNWRLDDIYNVQIVGRVKNEYEKGIYTLGFNKSITFEEHV